MPVYDSNEWPLQICKAKEAWDVALPSHGAGKSRGEDIIILHPDTGFTNHPELIKGNRYITSYPTAKNFFGRFSRGLTAEDTMSGTHKSHGTTTASLMLSDEGHPSLNPPNTDYPTYTEPITKFVTGIAPKVKVLPQRVCDFVVLHSMSSEHGGPVNTYVTLSRALLHGLSLNNPQIGVVSISLGGMRSQSTLQETLARCRREGLIVIAAAGQAFNTHGFKEPVFPGNSPHTICVGGCHKNLTRPSSGLYGNIIDITTPGWGVTVARTTGNTPTITTPNPPRHFEIDTNGEGTSYATAITAGACALWLAYHNRAKLIETYGKPFLFDLFIYCLKESCIKPSGWPRDRGHGVLNAEALLNYPLPSVSQVESSAISNGWTSSDWGDQSDWGRI